ncbi:MAG: hypothetical protein GQ540_09650 [Lutibacter sp.]|uniref:hypothetical protein n=1 Tax=Lutibacter sp. TaxID=1925666 RepID=UPI001A02458B|nr:hypothetical protein [Lutibacter sp.]NOR28773.1 hypothetical protein [Lutibacter sp.]
MKLSCDEATKICDKNQYGEASLWDKIRLSFHLFLCEKCGMYSKQNTVLTKCYNKQKDEEGRKEHCLSEADKKHLEKEVKARI